MRGMRDGYEDRCQTRVNTTQGKKDKRAQTALAIDGWKQWSDISDNVYNVIMTADSIVISMRLRAKSGERLKRMANRNGWTPSETSARLVEEGLRRAEFAFIDFRDSPAGRQAYIQGSSLAVWEVWMIGRDYRYDSAAIAKHLRWPEPKVQAALNYGRAFPKEIETAIAENAAMDFERLSRMLPQTKQFDLSKRTGKR